MKKNKTIDFIVIIITALFLLAVMTFTLGSLNSSGEVWFVKPNMYKGDAEKYIGESVILRRSDEGAAIKKIYVRIGNVYNTDKDGKIKFTIDSSSSNEEICKYGSYVALNRSQCFIESTDNSFTPGWYLLSEDFSISYNFIKFTTEQSFDFEEVVFFDNNNRQIKVSCVGGFEKGKFIEAEELKEVAAVCDAQDSFAFDSKHLLGSKEESLLGLAKNLYAYEGYYVSEKTTPLGALLCGFGVVFFGNSAFGLRIMPFLFSFATLISVYFIAKKIFNNEFYGVFAEVVWLLCGICLSLGGTGYPTAIALFFVLWAYYNAFVFYTDKSDSHGFFKYKSLFFGGVLISLAGAIDIFALTALPGLMFFYLVASARGIASVKKKYRLATGLQKEYLREQYTKVLSYSIIGNIISFIMMPFLYLLVTYGVFTPIYNDFYGTNNVFSAMLLNLSAIVGSNNGSFILGWLVGLSSEMVVGTVNRSISANKALIVCCFVLVLVYLALYFLNAKRKVKNSGLAESITTDFQIKFVILAFLFTFMTNLLGGFFADYSTFAYSLIFLTLVLPCSYNLYCKNVNGTFLGVSFGVVFAVSVLFFLLSIVCFLGIDIPQNVVRYLYGWTL